MFRLTLALQVFLERFKGDESRCCKDEYSHDILYVFAETDRLSDSQEDGFHVEPQHGDGDEEGPQQYDASLQMYGQIGLADAASEGLRSERVQRRSATESDAPSCRYKISWDPTSTIRITREY